MTTEKSVPQPTAEELAKQKETLHDNMMKVGDKLYELEQRLLEKSLPLSLMEDHLKEAQRWSAVLQWMRQVNINRFTMPEQMKKQQEGQPGRIVAPGSNGMKSVN